MQVFAFGINHRTAPVEIREQASFDPARLEAAVRDARDQGAANETTILSTCNRTEMYCVLEGERPDPALDWFCAYHELAPKEISPYLYRHTDTEAVRHAFRVAAGLDSMVLGEPQILGQMKDAFATAHKAGATGKLLNRLFQHTFAVAKQVRTDTAVGASAVSVAYAAVSLARRIFDDMSSKNVLLIGAGETIELVARHLTEQRVHHMVVANRTVERAQELAQHFGAEAISLGELPLRLAEADIVISSTASQLPILGKGAIEEALRSRRHRPMFMVDLAVPRDIEPQVDELGDVYLYSVDDLQGIIEENVASRRKAAAEAEAIIETQATGFMRWLDSLEAVPTIRRLRESTTAFRESELERARLRLAAGDAADVVLAELARSLTNKITHAPTAALRQAAQDGNPKLLDAARRLFDLPED
ncbi:MAG: glutamyl-tRNA reductase [Gammaproteobacteria bacterium]|nr:glutamyl-tRNA reductase [Gammaproteobacteria bacterium]